VLVKEEENSYFQCRTGNVVSHFSCYLFPLISTRYSVIYHSITVILLYFVFHSDSQIRAPYKYPAATTTITLIAVMFIGWQDSSRLQECICVKTSIFPWSNINTNSMCGTLKVVLVSFFSELNHNFTYSWFSTTLASKLRFWTLSSRDTSTARTNAVKWIYVIRWQYLQTVSNWQ